MELYLSTAEANRLEQVIEDCTAEHTMRYLRTCPVCNSVVERLIQEDISTDEDLWGNERIKFQCGLKLELSNHVWRLDIPVRTRVSATHFCTKGCLRWKKVLKRTEGVRHTMEFVAELEMDQAFKDVILNILEPLTSQARKDS